MREHLANTYGYSPKNIQETPTDFIVEGDQMFSKATYWEDHGGCSTHEYSIGAAPSADGSATDRKHYRYTYLVDKWTWPTIKVNIDYDGASPPKPGSNAIITRCCRGMERRRWSVPI